MIPGVIGVGIGGIPTAIFAVFKSAGIDASKK